MTSSLAPAAQQADVLTASTVMTAPVVTVGVTDPVLDVWRLMQSQHLGHVVVVDDDRCVGIVDVHDLWVSWAVDLEGPAQRTVAHLVTATSCVCPDTPIPLLCERLLDSRYGTVLVVDADGVLQGIVTASDVLRAVAEWKGPSC